MRIVVLDGHTLNPGDLDLAPLRALGECECHERTPATLTVSRSAGAAIVLTNKVVLDEPVLQQLPDLKYIGVTATGVNVVDVAAASQRGIVVTNVPSYGTMSVVQATFALLLELTHHVGEHCAGVRQGRWSHSPDFAYWDHPLVELDGLTMGIIGLGRIGQGVARVARALGLKIIAHRRPREYDGSMPVEFVTVDEVFRRGDVVSLHCPLTEETRGLVNARRLGSMKPSAFLINTSRGPVVNEADLADALNQGRIAGAGLDVLSTEPPRPDNPLLAARNCVITPHFAWATRAARTRLLEVTVDNVRAFLAGRPQNVVS